MRALTTFIIYLCIVSLQKAEAKKKPLKYDPDVMKDCNAKLDQIKPKIAKLKKDLKLVYKCMETPKTDPNWATYCVSPPADTFSSTGNQVPSGRMAKTEIQLPQDRSTAATAADIVAVGDMYLSGYTTKCGPQTITGWTSQLDIYYAAGSAADSTTTYAITGSGTYTAPVNGYYNICSFLRFKKGGNAVDVTVIVGGVTVAGFGDAVDGDWRSTGTCLIRELTAGQTVYIRNNSGGGSDCVEETAWRYGRLAVYLIGGKP